MTVLLSWNIQYGKGVDGAVDLKRIVDTARAMGPFDVFCAQELAVNIAGMGGGEDVDQTAALAALLPGYAAFFAPAVDLAGPGGRRQRFGNMIFSRLPVLAFTSRILPRPADPTVIHMPRGVAEALVETPGGPLRVLGRHCYSRQASFMRPFNTAERLKRMPKSCSPRRQRERWAGRVERAFKAVPAMEDTGTRRYGDTILNSN